MGLALADKWIWDFWLAEDCGTYHLFFLQAPKSLADPELRHWNVSIGHAVSDDLVDWTLRPDALAPSATPAWDDCSTWTGSIIRHCGRWYLFYTGTSHAEGGMVQRIGCALSDDLDHWERVAGPLIVSDPRWYEQRGAGWHDEAWRDPWVFRGGDGVFHALITARSNQGARLDRGCIGHARSHDLHDWEVLAPITTPGGFGQLEVPQVHAVDGTWHLIFCSDLETQADDRRRDGAGTGTYAVAGPTPLGPFDASSAQPLQVDRVGSTYAGRLIDHDGPKFLSWKRMGPDGRFVGELSHPSPVRLGPRGLEFEGGPT